ncbi:MAG: hypothetical protein ACLPWF_24595 [Bryobacteraceae bacterium]
MKISDPIAEVIPREFTPAEIEWNESQYAILNPDRASNLLAVLATPGYIASLEPAAARALEKQCIVAAAFHRMRGRIELCQEFEGLAIAIKAVIKAGEN